jgi:hypothetical protein
MTEDSQTPEAAPNSRERGPTEGPTRPYVGLAGDYVWAVYYERAIATRDRYEAALRAIHGATAEFLADDTTFARGVIEYVDGVAQEALAAAQEGDRT